MTTPAPYVRLCTRMRLRSPKSEAQRWLQTRQMTPCLEEEGHRPGEDGDFVVGAVVLQSAELRRTQQRHDMWSAKLNDKQPVTRVLVQE